ncbi:hypothetical protein BKA83DRAFT_4299880, partial [Pisolithus microcarpus]
MWSSTSMSWLAPVDVVTPVTMVGSCRCDVCGTASWPAETYRDLERMSYGIHSLRAPAHLYRSVGSKPLCTGQPGQLEFHC